MQSIRVGSGTNETPSILIVCDPIVRKMKSEDALENPQRTGRSTSTASSTEQIVLKIANPYCLSI